MKSYPRSESVPSPTLVLFLMAASVAWALFALDFGPERVAVIAIALFPLLIWGFHKLITTAEAGVVLLVAAAAMPRGYIEIFGLNARPEHIAICLLCVAVPFLLRRRPVHFGWMFADYLLVAYIGLNIFSSLFMSPDPPQTLKWSMQQVLVILPYFLLRVLAGDVSRFRWAFRTLLIVGALTAAYGVICYYSNFLFGTEFGVTVDQYGNIPATYGTQYEANILGAYCGACSVAMLAMYLQEKRRSFLVGYGVTLAGMAISLSRGALGASVIGFAALAYFARKRGLLKKRVLRSIGAATLCVVLVLLPVLATRYSERLSTLDVSDPSSDENTLTRLVQFAGAVEGFLKSPVFGNGTASFQLLFSQGIGEIDIGAETPWISNSELRILHDTGLVGFTVFVLFIGFLVRRSRRRLKSVSDPALLALLVSAVVYAVSFQATEGTILAFFWIHLGLIGCALCMQTPTTIDPITGSQGII